MLYIFVIILALIGTGVIYLLSRDSSEDTHNLMKDVPTISVNREGLEKHAIEISSYYSDVRNSNCRRTLMRSLDRSYKTLIKGYEYIDKEVKSKRDVVPAAEWLLDNLYLIEKEYKDIKHNMPEKYYNNLPVINKGIMKCYPRVYHIAVEIVSHTDGRVDESVINTFIKAYQKNTILTSGELWALPIMLRIAVIQNISKIVEKIVYAQEERKEGDLAADKVLNLIHDERPGAEIKRVFDSREEFSTHFTEGLLKVLRDSGIDNPDVFKYIDERLESQQSSTEKMIVSEHQMQAGFQVSIGNCITSLREIEALNWSDNFEKLSFTEQILRMDPKAVYEQMDFESRDYYRHKVERLSKYTGLAESYIAKKAVECAQENIENCSPDYAGHVGYYLIDNGTDELKKKLNYKGKWHQSFYKPIRKNRVSCYINAIFLSTLILILLITGINSIYYEVAWYEYVLAVVALIIPVSEIVISIINYTITHTMKPRIVPKLELKECIPEEYSTVVIIPTLLNNVNRVHDLVSDMEVYYLANQEKNLYFALLGDFKDSNSEHEEDDNSIVKAGLEDIKALNKKYCKEGEEIFFFLNRYRQYNEKQSLWLGHERKRGKIMEFNALLRGEKETSYNVISSDISSLQKVKYVITLDADTQLPRDSAKRLIGAMAHILNVPHINKEKKEVTRGYGLMQPRISVGTVCASKTLFSRIFSGETGIDLYTTAVSDVYQDLFGEGIFTGKGIYDLDTFEFMLKGEIPENAVLSHDLLEGSYVRTALVTDIELIDGYPAYYNASSMRLHRWVRGDWQLLPWVTGKKPLNRLSKYKMFDNLRRSLLAPSIMLLVILSVTLLRYSETYLIVAFLGLLFPMLFGVSDFVTAPAMGISVSGRVNSVKTVIEQIFLMFCFLPYQAYLMIDAIVRTLYRIYISRRNLLEWQTAADVEAKLGKKLNNFIAAMWIGSIFAILILVAAFYCDILTGLLLFPSCVLWFVSPYIAYYISKERKAAEVNISEKERETLRKLSRRTWSYFEDFVNIENNWLAPDNYQEDPDNGVAHRTSPTNIGMGVISNVSAYNLGYIGIVELVERIDVIMTNMESLPRFKGHFYNWYDTETKEPLRPVYVSTVDSGNLVGYLILTAQALGEYLKKPALSTNEGRGIYDTLMLANEEIDSAIGVKGHYDDIIRALKSYTSDVIQWKKILVDVWSKAGEIEKSQNGTNLYWNNKVKHDVSKFLKELQKLFPWIDLLIEADNKSSSIVEEAKKLAAAIPFEDLDSGIEDMLNDIRRKSNCGEVDKEWFEQLEQLLNNGKKEVDKVLSRIGNLRCRLNDMAMSTDFTILYDKKRQLFTIGYDVDKDSIQNCYYDLLASESRQASFLAIAKGDVEQKHWFKLGRSMTHMGKRKGLVSWSGTMFEYFMPLLIMRNYPNTLLDETYRGVLEGQKSYGRERRVPWGISESAFYTFDVNLNYQYKAFGVPGIGLKRGLVNELVVSPYSTVMALQIDLTGAVSNIIRLTEEGLLGRYGFYDAVDYTKERVPKGKKKALVKCFMVHHEGMSFMALDNALNDNILQNMFHNIPMVKATELLLQERVPKRVVYDREQQFEVANVSDEKQNVVVRTYNTAKTESPESHLLSNGSYSLMITNSGSGYSKRDDMTLYRWREDVTLDNTGMFFYIKNMNSNEFWSAAYEPSKCEGDNYEVIFSLDRAEFKRKDGKLSTHTEIAVSNEDNAEVRRITITNHSDHSREVEITSYCEVTLAPYNADIVHPAFSNLFIKTEFVDNPTCVIANRRPRAKGQKKPYLMQTVAIEGTAVGTIQYETSRANFIGRGRDLSNPKVMDTESPLQNTVGAVIDPIISIRRRVKIKAGQSCKIAFTTAVGDSKQEVIELARKYREMQNINRVFELAWTQTQVDMRYLGIKSSQANLYQVMASKVLFMNTMLRDREEYIKNIKKSQPALWPYGISGDLPIVLLVIRSENDTDLARQMLNAHEYWSSKGLKVDLVIVNLENTSYIHPLQDAVRDLISSSHARDRVNKPGGVFLHSTATMSSEVIELLLAISRLVIDSKEGPLVNQIRGSEEKRKDIESLPTADTVYDDKGEKYDTSKLEFYNSYGGFDNEKGEYVIVLDENRNTPAPWINVIANGDFGFHVSESGVSYTWYKNSRENKLTPWSNDSIMDMPGEALYLRDENSGKLWSITAKPIRDDGEYIVKHGFGYSSFTHTANGIRSQLTMFTPLNRNVKLHIVKLKNNTDKVRSLSLTYYAQTVIGVIPQGTGQFISTYLNCDKNYIYAQNPYNEHFGKSLVYLKIAGCSEESFTGDRTEFLGRGGDITKPEGLRRKHLSNTVGSGFDPCITENGKLNLQAGEEKTLVIMLGAEVEQNEIDKVIESFSNPEEAEDELRNIQSYWKKLLQTITVKTPDKSMDILINGWLMYQTIVCRIWSRTAFYQSGGAFGFRDQLQDVMAAGYLDTDFTKQQILYSASRQYVEGDVQHWWHPVVNSGIRTRFSDDLLWLPFVVVDYIRNTGDYSILDESVGYLEDEPLKEGEDERYNIVSRSETSGTIYEHCIRSIDYGLKFGPHNIPLMGSGDWNDGMSTVGNQGRGESVWLGWFLYSILDGFKYICKAKDDESNYNRFIEMQEFIRENLEANAWDGGWYRRAYFDDGTPLGSIENDECQIDSLSQSWSVISGAGREARVKEAMEALDKYLIREESGMIFLLTPPFNKSHLEPGYIKGYVPGVRENGGQYTHAATWVVLAYAKMGNGAKAWKLFNMINPINHAKTLLESERYKVEPYVMTADIYGKEPHTGRGGWSWYTGASGWMYRVGIEAILGFKYAGGYGFTIEPCVPDDWKSYEIRYTRENCVYNIIVSRAENKAIILDGEKCREGIVPFLESGEHNVEVYI